MKRGLLWVGLILLGGWGLSAAEGKKVATDTPADRGRAALFGRSFSPPVLGRKAYEDAWKQWGVPQKPADYDRAFRERYGLHVAPYDNAGLPMGLRQAQSLLGKGITNDCLVCHAGSVAGQTVIGLGNASLDLQSMFEDLAAANGMKSLTPFAVSHVRGMIEAEAVVLYLMQFRDADLNLRFPQKMSFRTSLCQDIPAWWHLKKKKTMFHTGTIDTRSVRANMPFMLSPLNSGAYIKKQEPVFRDIKAFLLTLEAPKYPFAIDGDKAARGKQVFVQNCARCHGTYGPEGTYPNKVVALDQVGTDGTLVEGYPARSWEHYRKSWFNQEKGPDGKSYWSEGTPGYQAPPLDGIWATAPYLHNGSVPTVYHLLNSRSRPKIHTRSYRTGKEDYDPVKLGWKVTVLDRPPDPKLPAFERRKVYDTTQPGRGNGGHTFGDKLTEAERMAVIEYLKTL
jgi:mono/diheme cytochrome c family protein